MSKERTFVIVTGAGRSGTSAVARVLHESGVRMGRNLAPPSEANPEGFYEDLNVVSINERLLTELGMSDAWRPERWASRAEVRAAGRSYRTEMAALARDAAGGWKDPRFAITLEAWLEVLPAPPNVIVCLRSPQAYAASVTSIYGLVKPERAMREWARHYRRLLAVVRAHKLRATCVEYDALVEQPVETVEALSRFAGRVLDARYVEPALRRQYAPVPETYRPLYERVARLGAGPRARIRVRGQGSRVRGQGSGVKGRGSRVETTDYSEMAGSLVARLVDAKTRWEAFVNMPSFDDAGDVRVACDDYNAILTQAQAEIAQLVPPAAFARDYEELRDRVNVERMIAQLALNAASDGGERSRRAAVRGWRRFGRAPIGE